MATLPKASVVISELEAIATQVEESKGKSREVLVLAKLLDSFSTKLIENRSILVSVANAVDANVSTVATEISIWASRLSPTATITWNQEEVKAKLGMLDAMVQLTNLGQGDFLTPEQVEQVGTLKARLNSGAVKMPTGNGDRKAREAQPIIEGKPERVTLTCNAGNCVDNTYSKQKGNVATTPGNLRAAVKSHMANVHEIELDKTALQAFGKVISNVLDEGYAKDEFGGQTIAVA
jgi:hypothetical protein